MKTKTAAWTSRWAGGYVCPACRSPWRVITTTPHWQHEGCARCARVDHLETRQAVRDWSAARTGGRR